MSRLFRATIINAILTVYIITTIYYAIDIGILAKFSSTTHQELPFMHSFKFKKINLINSTQGFSTLSLNLKPWRQYSIFFFIENYNSIFSLKSFNLVASSTVTGICTPYLSPHFKNLTYLILMIIIYLLLMALETQKLKAGSLCSPWEIDASDTSTVFHYLIGDKSTQFADQCFHITCTSQPFVVIKASFWTYVILEQPSPWGNYPLFSLLFIL